MKRLLLFIALGLAAGISTNLLMDRYCIPDLAHFRRTAEASDAWAEQLRQQERPCAVIIGSSETRTGIDPAAMLKEHDVPAILAAGHAGFGVWCNIVAAQPYIRKGDTVVLNLLSADALGSSPTTAGLKFCFQRQGFGMFSSGLIPPTPRYISSILMGNATPMLSYLARLYLPYEKRYRYHTKTIIHPSGWMEVQHRFKDKTVPIELKYAEKDTRKLVNSPSILDNYLQLQEHYRQMGADFIVHFPATLSSPGKRLHRAYHALVLTCAGIPVLKDKRLGTETDAELFSDTPRHLTGEGTLANSRILAEALKGRQVWTQEELTAFLRESGWDEETYPLPTAAAAQP